VKQRVLLIGIHGNVVVVTHATVHKFDYDLVANAFQIAITPALEGKG
jgi:hypothetical protein